MLSRLRRAWCFLTDRHHEWTKPVRMKPPFKQGDTVEVVRHPFIGVPAPALGTVSYTVFGREGAITFYGVRLCDTQGKRVERVFYPEEVQGPNWRDWHNLPRCG